MLDILRYDPSVVTATNKVAPASGPMQISAVGV